MRCAEVPKGAPEVKKEKSKGAGDIKLKLVLGCVDVWNLDVF